MQYGYGVVKGQTIPKWAKIGRTRTLWKISEFLTPGGCSERIIFS